MVTILMISAKMATPGLLKISLFCKKPTTSKFLSITSPKNFYHVIQIILQMWSFDQILVTVAFL